MAEERINLPYKLASRPAEKQSKKKDDSPNIYTTVQAAWKWSLLFVIAISHISKILVFLHLISTGLLHSKIFVYYKIIRLLSYDPAIL